MENPGSEPEREDVPASLEEKIEALGEWYIEAMRRGESLDRDSLIRSHPDLSPWLERRLDLMEWIHWLSCSKDHG
jgi:hypothetical protein